MVTVATFGVSRITSGWPRESTKLQVKNSSASLTSSSVVGTMTCIWLSVTNAEKVIVWPTDWKSESVQSETYKKISNLKRTRQTV